MNKVRIGIIGIGGMGTGHCKRIVDGVVANMELTAVADIRPERLEFAKKNFSGVATFDDGIKLLDSGLVDAVIIATPHYGHPIYAQEAFKRGIHVMCEKPAGVYTKEVRKMNEAATESGVVFGMMFNQRTNHIYRKMKEIVDSGELGAIKRVNWIITTWYRTQNYYNSGDWRATWSGEGGGVLLNQCPHNLDLLQWICGMPSKVTAFCHEGKWHDIEVEDDVTAYLEFPNGATGVFVTTTADLPGTNRFEITLEKGKIICEIDHTEPGKQSGISVYKLDVNERDYCYQSKETFKQPNGEWLKVETDGKNPQHNGVCRAFADKILHGTPMVAEGQEGINGLMLSNAMHLSSWLGKTVSLPIDEDLFLAELNKKIENSTFTKKSTGVTLDLEGSY